MKRTALFLSLLMAILKFTQAQPSLGIFSNSISVVPNPVNFNQTVTFTFDVVNTGNSFFNGSFSIYYAVNDSFQGVLDSLVNNYQIDIGESAQVIIENQEITPLKYAIGDNIVVIWPVAWDGNTLTTDSGTVIIVVDTALAIGPPILKQQIRVFYKSGDQSLFIDYGDMISQIKDVSCYSILGRQTRKYNYPVSKISLAESSPKVFLLVVRTKEGETISFKILRI